MSNLYCAYCHNIINENDIVLWQEKTPRIGIDDPFKCEHYLCPVCHEEGMFEEMERCKLCGEEIIPDEIWCEDCKEVLSNAWSAAVKEVRAASPHKPYKDIEELIVDWLEWEAIL